MVKEDGTIDRHYYELCALSELREALKSGDIWVENSRGFGDFDTYLLTKEEWRKKVITNTTGLAVPADFNTYWLERSTLLHERLSEVAELIRTGKLPELTIEKGDFHLNALAKDIPEGVEELREQAYLLLPRIKITDLLVEIDELTGFSRHFTHQQTGETVPDKAILLTAILADGINLGLQRMAEASVGLGAKRAKRLTWVSDWYLREETYRKALAELVNFQQTLPLAGRYGQGKTSSSDGQQFRVGGVKSSGAKVNLKYGREPGVMFYTHISDQYAPYHIQVISTTARQAPYMVDGLLYHQSNLKIEEHYTDTHGYTDQIFGATHLLGFRFAPRIKDVGDKTLYCLGSKEGYGDLASLLNENFNLNVIMRNWDDLLRLFGSIRHGTVTASLILNKLAAYPRQNRLALALRELGRIEKTLFILDWMQDPKLRRRTLIGLNKGEQRNSLAQALFFHRLGEVRDRTWEDQINRASGLTLLTAIIATWNTIYLEKALTFMQENGVKMTDEQIAHISPLGWEHIGLTGEYFWKLNAAYNLDNLRPLRSKKLKLKRVKKEQ